jgi:hypothetical protein
MNATVSDFSEIDSAVEELLDAARREADAWDELAARANGLSQRFHGAIESLQSAKQELESAGIPSVDLVAVVLSQQIDVLRATLQRSAAEAGGLADRVGAAFVRLEAGDVADGMNDLESSVAGVADMTGMAIDELADSVAETANQVLDELPARGAEMTEALSAQLAGLGEAFDAEMAAAITESIEDFEQDLTDVVDAGCALLNEAGETLGESVDSIVEDAQSKLTDLGDDWRDGMSSLEESYSRLGEDISGLGDDIRSTYSLVVDGMSSAGIGANAAGSALTDVQSLMSGVS